MKKHRFKLVLIFVAAGIVGFYFLNPSGTATWDPRARMLGVTTFHIASMSMAPTLVKGDFIVVQASAYASKSPKSGELIVFRFPRNRAVSFVSRVAGGPGDKLSIKDGKVYLNGGLIREPYLDARLPVESFSLAMDEITIPAEHLFVLGDNRDNSNDSRFWGVLPIDDVIGKVVYIWMAENAERVGEID